MALQDAAYRALAAGFTAAEIHEEVDHVARCRNCSETGKRLYETRENGLVCLRCIRANVDSRPEFARADGSDD